MAPFGVLLALAKDARLETSFRATCLIYLEAWRYDQPLAEQWLLALHELLSAKVVRPRRTRAAVSEDFRSPALGPHPGFSEAHPVFSGFFGGS